MSDLRAKLIGSWRMVDWALTDGEKADHFVPPFGYPQDCGGILIYSEGGAMSAMLSQNGRASFADPSLDGGTVEERAKAFGSITAYAGTFETDDATSQVTHVVQYATLPHFVGQRMMRICIFNGDRLKLDTPTMMIGGVPRKSYIEWERFN